MLMFFDNIAISIFYFTGISVGVNRGVLDLGVENIEHFYRLSPTKKYVSKNPIKFFCVSQNEWNQPQLHTFYLLSHKGKGSESLARTHS